MASIRTFLVYVRPGSRERVAALLRQEAGCDIDPSENADVIVLVTNHDSRADEDRFDERLAALDGVAGVALVSGDRADAAALEP